MVDTVTGTNGRGPKRMVPILRNAFIVAEDLTGTVDFSITRQTACLADFNNQFGVAGPR